MQPLASVTELELHLGRTLDTDTATQALELASGAVRAYCKWNLSYTIDDVMEVYGDGSHILTLPTLCLIDVKEIIVDLVDLGPLTRSVDLMWTRKGQIKYTPGWCKDQVVLVTCDHGYDPIPDVIRLVTLDAAARQLANPEGLVASRVGEVSRTYTSTSVTTANLTTLHQALLDNHRLFP